MRQVAREHGIDVLMLSDFGHCAHVFWNAFSQSRVTKLGYAVSDEVLLESLAQTRQGDRKKVFKFVGDLVGDGFARDQFQNYIDGAGEQPTSSLPQSGATAMASGAIGGKEIALHVLGHPVPEMGRVVYDFQKRESSS